MKWFKKHKTKIDKVISAEFVDEKTNYPVCSIKVPDEILEDTKDNLQYYSNVNLNSVKAPTATEPSLYSNCANTEKPEENFVWVEGYKGTDKDMKCNGYQYEFGKIHIYEGTPKLCQAGFHFCKQLDNVFKYYPIGNNHRYFKVRAKYNPKANPFPGLSSILFNSDKEVAIEIEFLEELDITETIMSQFFSVIKRQITGKGFSTLDKNITDRFLENKDYYINKIKSSEASYKSIVDDIISESLTKYYSPALVSFMVNNSLSLKVMDTALILGPDDTISNDMKIALAFSNNNK